MTPTFPDDLDRPGAAAEGGVLREYLAVVRRRWPVLLVALVLLPAVALASTAGQEDRYEALSRVLLSQRNLADALAGVQSTPSVQDPERIADTQVQVARVPALALRVLQDVGANDRSPQDLLRNSTVEAGGGSDVLTFSVTDADPSMAERLATAYAEQYTSYRGELETAAVKRAIRDVSDTLERLRAEGQESSGIYESLTDKQQQLRTIETLQTSNAVVLQRADTATQVQPTPLRSALVALAAGLLLGLLLVALWEALDTRVRTSEDAERLLGLPLLGRLPGLARHASSLVMLDRARSAEAESYRFLRIVVELAMAERPVRSLAVMSPTGRQGNSTTAANLAASLVRPDRRVALVDLDLRRPSLWRLFSVPRAPGVVDVALEHIHLAAAVHPIALPLEADAASANGTGLRGRDADLHLLTSGTDGLTPGEFIRSPLLGTLLDALQAQYDLVVFDVPPLLKVGDLAAISSRMDACILTVRLRHIRRQALRETVRVIAGLPVRVLGFVAVGGADSVAQAYGEQAAPALARRERSLTS
jgi:Mrp family chromosome partitioning ATPase/ElaB/YqjD/DUF883 family membrane-anchored ribosome-binding protein